MMCVQDSLGGVRRWILCLIWEVNKTAYIYINRNKELCFVVLLFVSV